MLEGLKDERRGIYVLYKFMRKTDRFNGLVIHTKFSPSWESLAALSFHLKFVQEHHKKVSPVAFSTNLVVVNITEAIASHFVNTEIKLFTYQEPEQAKD